MKMRFSYGLAVVTVFLLGQHSAFAVTQVPVAYADSAAGNDANVNSTPACGRTTPCKTMATALSAITNPGTVIVAADSEFAPFTITAGQSISCPGVACIVNSSGGATGIAVSAGTNDTVILNGVSISGFGTGGTGILVNSVGKLELSHVSISGNNLNVSFSPNSGTNAHLFAHDSEVRYTSNQNFLIAPTNGSSVSALIRGMLIHHGSAGLRLDATAGGSGVSATIEDSTISYHNNNGLAVVANGTGCPTTPSGPFARALITRSVVSYTSTNAVNSNGCSSQVLLDNSMITQNGTGIIVQNNGNVTTESNNAVSFNTTNVNGTLNHATPQ